MLSGIVNVGSVDCQKHHSICQGENVRAYPEIRLFPQNSNRRDQYQYVFRTFCNSNTITHTVQQVKWFSLIVNRSYNGWHRDAFSLKTWALRWAEIILTKYSPTMWTILLVAFSICIMQIVILTQSTRQTWLTNFSREFEAFFHFWLHLFRMLSM